MSREDQMLTMDEAADYLRLALNTPITTTTMRNWRAKGRGPHGVKVARRIRYARSALDTYIAELLGATDG